MRISDGLRRARATGYTKIAKTGAEAAGKVPKREMNSLNFRRADRAKSLERARRLKKRKLPAGGAEKDNRREPRFMGRGEEI